MLNKNKIIRCPVASGILYPEDITETLASIRAFCRNSEERGFAQAIVAPHGAWEVSGALACAAFSAAQGRGAKVRTVVILGPIHDRREEGVFLSSSDFFQTPIGMLAVNQEISKKLKSAGRFLQINDIPHLSEHSIEVLLPFIKYFFPDASIVPILAGGRPNAGVTDDIANAFNAVFSPILGDTLFVVSCNLSNVKDKSKARSMAEETLKMVYAKNASRLLYALESGEINACAAALVAALLKSGLLDGCRPRFAGGGLTSAVDRAENSGSAENTVFFGALSFD